MKVLSLWEPWASLVVCGEKRVETRAWSTGYRGPLAIHATQTLTAAGLEMLRDPLVREALKRHGVRTDKRAFALGCIIGVVELVDVVATATAAEDAMLRGLCEDPVVRARERQFGNYAAGRFAWLLDAPERLVPPVRARGRQRLWAPPAGLTVSV